MSKVLITLLGNKIETLKATNIINSLVKENPHSEINILTFKENESVISLMTNISHTFWVDSQTVASMLNSPLYCDAFAINMFLESIDECLKKDWDKIINATNDNISSYLISMMNAKEIIGTTISSFGSPVSSNKWAAYLNFVNSKVNENIISNNTVKHHMLNIPFYKAGKKIKINEEYSTLAAQNFSKIRRSKSQSSNLNIVGISLESINGQGIDYDSLVEIIETLESSEDYRAVLLLTGTQEEKTLANKLNQKFNNTLISINSDYSAFPSVVVNIDTLITVGNIHETIADALETRIIQVIPAGSTNTFTEIVNAGNYIVLQVDNSNIASDVNFILNQEFETNLPVQSMNSKHLTYMMIEDDFGILKTQIRGELKLQQELRYHIERYFHYQMLGYGENKELISHIRSHTQKIDLEKFCSQVKDELTDTVKILLAALRSLKGVKQSKNNLQNFIGYLDNLILKGKTNTITSGAICLFEAAIENVDTQDADENMRQIEAHLFSLKSDMQILANIVSDLLSDKIEDHAKNEKTQNTL